MHHDNYLLPNPIFPAALSFASNVFQYLFLQHFHTHFVLPLAGLSRIFLACVSFCMCGCGNLHLIFAMTSLWSLTEMKIPFTPKEIKNAIKKLKMGKVQDAS